MNDEIEKTVPIRGEDYLLKRIVMGNLAEVTACVDPFLTEFIAIQKKNKGGIGPEDIFRLCGYHRDSMVNLAVILTDKDKSHYEHLDPSIFVELLCEIIGYCGDFFLRKWINPLIQMGARLSVLSLTLHSLSSTQDLPDEK